MRFGINLPNFGPGTEADTLRGWGQTAEELGYHLVTVSDHIALTEDANTRSPAPFYESFTTLAWLAGITTDIELGTGVVITPHRHPLHLARSAATLDRLSGGRLILGAGVGWTRHAFAALDVPFTKRGALTNEYLEALHVLWTNEIASFHGKTINFDGVHTAPHPVRKPHPPIWIGGNSPAAIRRAARFGTAWHPLWPQGLELPEALQLLKTEAAQAGRPTPDFCPALPLGLTDRPVPQHQRRLGHGNLEQLHDDLSALQNLGAKYVTLNTDLGSAQLRRQPEEEWALLRLVAEKVIDTGQEQLR